MASSTHGVLTHFLYSSPISMLAVILIMMLWLSISEVNARPNWQNTPAILLQQPMPATLCDNDSEVMELCQRCAKATKAGNAYPMCCADEDHARRWCSDYIYFGLP